MSDPARSARSVRARLAQIVLGVEVLVVFLGGLAFWGFAVVGASGLSPGLVIAVGVAFTVLLVVAATMTRYRVGIALGWVLQALLCATGVLHLAMFVVGALFTGIWCYAMVAGARIDRSIRVSSEKDVREP